MRLPILHDKMNSLLTKQLLLLNTASVLLNCHCIILFRFFHLVANTGFPFITISQVKVFISSNGCQLNEHSSAVVLTNVWVSLSSLMHQHSHCHLVARTIDDCKSKILKRIENNKKNIE